MIDKTSTTRGFSESRAEKYLRDATFGKERAEQISDPIHSSSPATRVRSREPPSGALGNFPVPSRGRRRAARDLPHYRGTPAAQRRPPGMF